MFFFFKRPRSDAVFFLKRNQNFRIVTTSKTSKSISNDTLPLTRPHLLQQGHTYSSKVTPSNCATPNEPGGPTPTVFSLLLFLYLCARRHHHYVYLFGICGIVGTEHLSVLFMFWCPEQCLAHARSVALICCLTHSNGELSESALSSSSQTPSLQGLPNLI